jgi:hypothetical protein
MKDSWPWNTCVYICMCVCVCVCVTKMTAPAFVTFGTDERITYSILRKGTENAKMRVILRQQVMGICIGLIWSCTYERQ